MAGKRGTLSGLLVGEQQVGLSPALQINPFPALVLTCTAPYAFHTPGAYRFAFPDFITQAVTPSLALLRLPRVLGVAKNCF